MLFFSLFLFVSGYYYQQNDVGGYSLGVGGAPIGMNNSVECGLYNPAAFSGVEKMNVFSGCKVTKGEMSPIPMPDDISRLDYAFPDYLGVALPVGGGYFLSITLSVPYKFANRDSMSFTAIDTSGVITVSGEYVESEKFYFLNPAVGKVINDKISVGLNMGLFWQRSSAYIVADGTEYDGYFSHIDKYGIEPCLGLQYRASDIFSFGFLIKKGFGEAYKRNSNGTVSSIEADEGLPLIVGLGSEISLQDKIYLNASAEYMHWTLAYSDGYWDYRNIIRLHLGGQYKLNDLLSLSTGFYTEPSPVKIGPEFDPDSWDQIFLTGGVGLDFGRVALNFSAASSALIKIDPSLREENHFNLSLSYR